MNGSFNCLLSAERAREILRFYPDTGSLMRLAGRGSKARERVAGWLNGSGYRSLEIGGATYKVHRVIWLMQTGHWPARYVDHINGVKWDNRWLNLREATDAENTQNERVARPNNVTGFLGVSPDGGRYKAQIWHTNRKWNLGRFDTPELAHAAYLDAKRKHHSFCTI